MLTKRAGCTNINAVNASFLDVRPEQHAYVELILLDPSCSGSGIISRLDQLVDNQQRVGEHDEADGKDMNASDRLQALADFQVQMIEHAMKCMLAVECEDERGITHSLHCSPWCSAYILFHVLHSSGGERTCCCESSVEGCEFVVCASNTAGMASSWHCCRGSTRNDCNQRIGQVSLCRRDRKRTGALRSRA